MKIESIHHVSLTVRDLERSRKFYSEILGLCEIERPNFPFPGAWFEVPGGQQHVHLIIHAHATFRPTLTIDNRDSHFAVRVPSYEKAVEFLVLKGYREDAPDGDPRGMRTNPHATAGFPQIYIVDPDGHVIEINATALKLTLD